MTYADLIASDTLSLVATVNAAHLRELREVGRLLAQRADARAVQTAWLKENQGNLTQCDVHVPDAHSTLYDRLCAIGHRAGWVHPSAYVDRAFLAAFRDDPLAEDGSPEMRLMVRLRDAILARLSVTQGETPRKDGEE